MNDRTIEISDLADPLREFVRECEVTGRRTAFTSGGRRVSVIISQDEYLAMTESVDIAANPDQLEEIRQAEQDVKKNALLLLEDLVGE